MVTVEELTALVEILNRCPVSKGEGLWLQAFIEKLTPQPVSVQPKTSIEEAEETNE